MDVQTAAPAPPPLPLSVTAWSLGYTVSVLAGGMVSATLPMIAHDLGVRPAGAIWVMNAFAIATTITILPAAALADSWGYKRIFQIGTVLFGLAALLAAIAPSYPVMLICRALQGVGAGFTTACLGHYVRTTFPPERMGRAIAFNSMTVQTSAGGGPAVAGLILAVASWHWVFAGVAAVSLLSFGLSHKGLRTSPKTPQKIDLTTVALNGAAMTLLILAVQGVADGAPLWLLALEAAGCAGTGWLVIRRELRATRPMLAVDLLTIPIIRLSALTMIICFVAQGMAAAALPFFLNSQTPGSAARLGLLLACWPLGGVMVGPIAGRLADRYPVAVLSGAGMAIFTLGLVLTALIPHGAHALDVVWRMILLGIGFSLFGPVNTRGMIMGAPADRTGAATGLNAALRGLSQAMGAAVAAAILGLVAHGAATEASTRMVLLGAGLVAAVGVALCLSRIWRLAKRRG